MSEIDKDTIERIAEAVAARARPAPELPVSVALWDTAAIGAYLHRSLNRVRADIVSLPSFPRPIRLPVPGRAQALYKAREVIAWAESHTS
ncbi:MAG: hypothetical protein V4633_13300 [Pseudomonadota bacterium]